MKVLSSGCADCVLARKDVQAFDNQAGMRKQAARPDSSYRRRLQGAECLRHSSSTDQSGA
ncbi:hypothetical protein [Lacrimispora sp. 210928-DFI.3.58]|uniref:hypothetical protein n=1 Tax=Lacrimispora sp. 210928-DFI.3.58 TaxID=2883214 RepID=UPI001D06EE35|nr:hypothetical protein [Lacrimispora sp. 210928-DFI.3.58]